MQTFTVRNDKGQTFEVDEDKAHLAEKDGFLPVVSNGKEEHRVSFSDMPLAMKDGFQPIAAAPMREPAKEESFFQKMRSPEMQAKLEQDTKDAVKQQDEVAATGRDATLNALTLDYLPQIKAKAGQIFSGEGIANDENYIRRRDEEIAREKANAEKYPGAHAVGTAQGIAIPIIASLGTAAPVAVGEQLAAQGFKAGAKRIAAQTAKGAATGAAFGFAGNPGDQQGVVDATQVDRRIENAKHGAKFGAALSGGLNSLVETAPLARKAGEKLGLFAGDMAETATGATRTQAEKFAERSGRELLDRKHIKFGDTPAKIAERVGKANDEAAAQISSALTSLDKKGVKASQDNIVAALEARAKELEKDPSQSAVAKKLRAIVDDIVNTGESEILASTAEKTKRGFGGGIKNWADPDAGKANKEAYLAYRDEVERAATAAAPETAAAFKKGKETFGLLTPIEEAAEKRAKQLNQSPVGGLADITAAAAGLLKAGPAGAVIAPIARRVIAPRTASSIAVTADVLSKKLLAIPEMAAMAEKNPQQFKAAVLSLTNAEVTGAKAIPAAARAADSQEPTNELDKDSSVPASYKIPPDGAKNEPLKGRDKWASDGLEKIGDKDLLAKRSELLADPQAKALLVSASKLKPGSKFFDQIITRLKERAEKASS